MEIRTIFELTCASGFAAYVCWSLYCIWELARRVVARDIRITQQCAINKVLSETLAELRQEVDARSATIQAEFDALLKKIAELKSSQPNQAVN